MSPCSPERGPYGNRRPFPEPYLAYSSGSPVKEPYLQVPLTELPQTERDAPFSEPSFMSLKKSRKMNPLQVLQRGPLWRELPVSRAFFYMSLDFILKFLLINRNFTLLSKALGKERPHVPQNGDPTETDAHFQSLT
jgi:hypothetical protein